MLSPLNDFKQAFIVPNKTLQAPRWPFVLNKEHNSARNVIGYWPLINGIDKDLSIYNRAAVPINSPAYTSNNIGASVLDLDNSNKHSEVSATDIGTTSVTISCFIEIDAFTSTTFDASPKDTGAQIFSTRGTGSNRSPTLVASNIAGGAGSNMGLIISFDSSDGGGTALGTKGSTSLQVGTTYHFVGRFDYDANIATYKGNWDVFINGIKDNSTVNNWSLARSVILPFTGSTWFLGYSPLWPTGGGDGLDGRLWNFLLFNTALTDAEIWQLYDPSTRWDLAYELGRTLYFFPSTVIPDPPSPPTNNDGVINISGSLKLSGGVDF